MTAVSPRPSLNPTDSRFALEPDSFPPSDQESIIASLSPSVPLNVSRVRIGDIRPPLRSRRTVREHASDDPLNLRECEFEVGRALAFQVVAEGIVFCHLCKMPENDTRASGASEPGKPLTCCDSTTQRHLANKAWTSKCTTKSTDLLRSI